MPKNQSSAPASTLPKSPTGIQGLDEITGGGLPAGRPTLVCGSAGCGKTMLAMEFLVRGATLFDEPGVFMMFEESAAKPRRHDPPARRQWPDRGKPMNGGTPPGNEQVPALHELRLYVAGQTPKSLDALANLKRICESHLVGQYRIEVIDLIKNPQLAAGDQILAVPTRVRLLPEPIKKIIGDLSNEERGLVGLDVQPMKR